MSSPTKQGLGIAEIIGDKREAVLALVAQHGAANVRVFGSVARNEASVESDVDLLVTFPKEKSIFDLVALWLDLQDLLGREVSLVTESMLRDRFQANVLQDAVAL